MTRVDPPTISATRFCCGDCGGHRVEVLDWVTVNEGRLVGGDAGTDYWCPDCETHPSQTDQREVTFALCDDCARHEWATSVPIPGLRVNSNGVVESCEKCGLFADDCEAALALGAELSRRGGQGRVSYVVDLSTPVR